MENNAETELDGNISDTDTVISVVDASQFTAPCRLTIDSEDGNLEIIEVESISGDTLENVDRGLEDTTAQSWSSGTLIDQRVTKGVYEELFGNQTLEAGSIAIGEDVFVEEGADNAVVIGKNAENFDFGDNVVIGENATGTRSRMVVIGSGAGQTTNQFQTASVYIGDRAGNDSGSQDAVAIGTQAQSFTDRGVAVGGQAEANENAVSIGYRSEAQGQASISIGGVEDFDNVVAGADKTLAISALNQDVEVTNSGEGFIGVDQLQFGVIENTIPDTDLNNEFATFETTNNGDSFQVRWKDGDGNVNVEEVGGGGGEPAGNDTEIQFNDNGEFGSSPDFTWNDTDKKIEVGDEDVHIESSSGFSGVLLGDVNDIRSIAIGGNVDNARDTVTIGKDSSTYDEYAVALGNGASAWGVGHIAIGELARAETDSEEDTGAIAIGKDAFSESDGTIAIGKNATVGNTLTTDGYENSIALGTNAEIVDDNLMVVAFGDGNVLELDDFGNLDIDGDLTVDQTVNGLSQPTQDDEAANKQYVDENTGGGEAVAFETGHTNYESDLTDEEIHRIRTASGETFNLEKVEFHAKGGGDEDTGKTVDVYDETSDTVVDSANLNTVSTDGGDTDSGSDVIVRISTDAETAATIRVVGEIR